MGLEQLLDTLVFSGCSLQLYAMATSTVIHLIFEISGIVQVQLPEYDDQCLQKIGFSRILQVAKFLDLQPFDMHVQSFESGASAPL